jgi:Raf kinase inhibitor-like YbhB/YbcL family protein
MQLRRQAGPLGFRESCKSRKAPTLVQGTECPWILPTIATMIARRWLAVGLLLMGGCGRGGDAMNAGRLEGTAAAAGKLTVTSPAFAQADKVPKEYTGEGEDRSPPLTWTGAPAGTREFAIIVQDPDAPVGTWYHWVLYNLPATVTSLPAGVPREAVLNQPVQGRQGRNSWPNINVGYRGPMPPNGHGPHRYYFMVYAVDAHIELAPNLATADALKKKLAGHVLAEGSLLGFYERK